MKIAQTTLVHLPADLEKLASLQSIQPNLILVFGCTGHFIDPILYQGLREHFPQAELAGCSTAGEIATTGVLSHTSVVTALRFERSTFQIAKAELISMEHSFEAGCDLAQQLNSADLRAVMVFGQGVAINGSAMIDGLVSQLAQHMPVTGGLAGDDGAFVKTYTLTTAGVSSTQLVGIGLLGEKLLFAHGSYGGWKPFGPTRKVSRCVGNVLYELDGEPALEVYKRYLGEYAKDLPGSGLLFPFEMLGGAGESLGQIRTILGIDEVQGSLILAGMINPDGYLRLMHAHTTDLVEGAAIAAKDTVASLAANDGQALGLLVSCVGRKLVMGGRVDEEIEAVQEVLGSQTLLCGFYSNGEICPGYQLKSCSLHNQTMTITYLAEVA